ncbi:MAG: glycoside hydrolase family 10 protein [Calditrichaceae bacterium]
MIRLFYLFFILLLTVQYTHATENQRAMWVVRHALTSPDEIRSIISVSEKLNITDIYVQVRALGENYYSPHQETNVPALFHSLIKDAKRKNIKVHAWLNILYIWTGNDEPDNKNHVFYKASSSILRSADYSEIPKYTSLKKEGIEGYFISPSDTINLNEVKMLIVDLINNYQVDGIHLDYFRYPDIKYSVSPLSRTEFMLQNSIDPEKIYSDVTEFTNQRGYKTFIYLDEMYREFLRDSLSDMLIRIKNHIHILNNKIELSVAVKPNLIQARHRYFQDWGMWLKKDLCDKVILMNYKTDYESFKQNLSLAQTLQSDDKIIIGISTYNQNENAVKQRVKLVSNMDFAGYALFSYNYLSENKKYLEKIVFADKTGGKNGKDNSSSAGN